MDRVVIDTNIFVSAVMNADGAPREVLRLALSREIKPIFGNALFLEYEDVLGREALFARSPASRAEREALFNALLSVSDWRPIYFLWRPNLPRRGRQSCARIGRRGWGERDHHGQHPRFRARRNGIPGIENPDGGRLSKSETIPMSTLTIRLPDDQHERLRILASHRGVSLDKLIEDFSARALAEFDVELRFRARAASGDPAQGMAILDALDARHAGKAG